METILRKKYIIPLVYALGVVSLLILLRWGGLEELIKPDYVSTSLIAVGFFGLGIIILITIFTIYKTVSGKNIKHTTYFISGILVFSLSVFAGGIAYTIFEKQNKVEIENIARNLSAIAELKGIKQPLRKESSKKAFEALREGRYDDAEQYFNTILGEYKNSAPKTNAHFNLGRVFFDNYEYVKANKQFLITFELAEERKDEKTQALVLNDLGNTELALGDLDGALDYYYKSLGLAKKTDDKEGIATNYSNIAYIFSQKGELDKALSLNETALKYYTNENPGRVNVLNNIGTIYILKGYPKEGLTYYEEALTTTKVIGDLGAEVETLNHMAFALWELDDLNGALEYYEKALDKNTEIGSVAEEAETLNNIGSILAIKGDLDGALKTQKEALNIYKNIRNYEGEARASFNIGSILYRKGDLKSSLPYFQNALEIYRKLGMKRDEALVSRFSGHVYIKEGRTEEGLRYLEDSLSIYITFGPSPEIEELRNEINNIKKSERKY